MLAIQSKVDPQTRLYERSLRDFVRPAWSQIDPRPLQWAPYIDVICEHLQAVAELQIRKLLINIPPRMGKTLLISNIFPAWRWSTAPEVRFLTASYDQKLGSRDARKMRALIRSDWYQRQWGPFAVDGSVIYFENVPGGHRVCVSPTSGATGHGGDILIFDDPHDVHQTSPQERDNTADWWLGAMATRGDTKEAARIVVGQRVAKGDLSDRLIETGDYVHLCLPMRYERTHMYVCKADPRTVEGELLHPVRLDDDDVAELERSLGPNGTAAQLQQRPEQPEGLVYGDYSPALHKVKAHDLPYEWERFAGIDFGTRNPFCHLWGARDPADDVLHIYREHYESQWTLRRHATAIWRAESCPTCFREERLGSVEWWDHYGYVEESEDKWIKCTDCDGTGRTEPDPDMRWADPAGKQERTDLAGEYNMATATAKKDVTIGINAVKERLALDVNDKPHLVIHDCCVNLLREMERYTWPSKRGDADPTDKPLKRDDHAMDALRYLVMGMRSLGY